MVFRTRRSILAQVGVLLTFALSGKLSVIPSAYAIGWDTLVTLATKLPSLSDITKDIKGATNNVIATYDSSTLQVWRAKLADLRSAMIDLNTTKAQNLDDVKAYIDRKPGHKIWSALQVEWKTIPPEIDQLMPSMKVGTDQKVMTISAASTLQKTLKSQRDLYTDLSTTPEPRTHQQIQDFQNIYAHMKELYSQIQGLESAIDDYLEKHPAPT